MFCIVEANVLQSLYRVRQIGRAKLFEFSAKFSFSYQITIRLLDYVFNCLVEGLM